MDCSLRAEAEGGQDKEESERSFSSSWESGDWRNKSLTVLSRTSSLLDLPEMRDVKFIFPGKEGECEERIVWGHKCILAMACPVFYKMFYPEENAQFVSIVGGKVMMVDHDFSAEAFQTFLKFLYTDKINYEESFVFISEILKCADYYDVPYLKSECAQKLEKCISTVSVIPIFETAFLHSETELQNKCMAFIEQNLRDVFESQEILSCKVQTLFEILKRDSLDMDECHLLDLALKWAENECNRRGLECTVRNKRQVLGPVFFEIRFALLTSAKISEIVNSNLLTQAETVDLLLEIHTPGNLKDPSSDLDSSDSESVFKLAPDVSFKSNLRRFGSKEIEMLNSKWKEDYRKSFASAYANLHITGCYIGMRMIEHYVKSSGFDKDLQVTKERDGEFRVRFTYCPAKNSPEEFLNPHFFGIKNHDKIKIQEWSDKDLDESENEDVDGDDLYPSFTLPVLDVEEDQVDLLI